MDTNRMQMILTELAEAVVSLDETRATDAAHKALNEGLDSYTAIQDGLLAGMNRAGQLFEEQEYFVPELLVASDALYAGLNVLRPHIKGNGLGATTKVVIGVGEVPGEGRRGGRRGHRPLHAHDDDDGEHGRDREPAREAEPPRPLQGHRWRLAALEGLRRQDRGQRLREGRGRRRGPLETAGPADHDRRELTAPSPARRSQRRENHARECEPQGAPAPRTETAARGP